jgi:hypothetical protein
MKITEYPQHTERNERANGGTAKPVLAPFRLGDPGGHAPALSASVQALEVFSKARYLWGVRIVYSRGCFSIRLLPSGCVRKPFYVGRVPQEYTPSVKRLSSLPENKIRD